MNSLDKKFEAWFAAAYDYYWLDGSDMHDGVWDQIGKELKNEWELITHPMKYVVEYENMGSLHYVPRKVFEEYFTR